MDYGTGPLVRDSHTGKYRRTRFFVFTLGFSRKCIRLLSFQSSSRIWGELHETCVPANGWHAEGHRPRQFCGKAYCSPTYTTLRSIRCSAIYSRTTVCVAMPCRIRDPDRKGKVESSVSHAQKTPLKGQRFENLAEAQAYLDQ